LYVSAKAWHARVGLLDPKNQPVNRVKAMDVARLFVDAGILHLSAGDVRNGFDLFAESIALMYWSQIGNQDEIMVPRFSCTLGEFWDLIYGVIVHIEDPHISCRLVVLRCFADGFIKGFTMERLALLYQLAEASAASFEDARTYLQGTLAGLIFEHRMKLRLTSTGAVAFKPMLIESLYEIMEQERRGLTAQAFGEWLRSFVAMPTVLLLYA
ncbi:MAG: hypothetical protein ACRDRL_33760, partial [Sciscionella sp.]